MDLDSDDEDDAETDDDQEPEPPTEDKEEAAKLTPQQLKQRTAEEIEKALAAAQQGTRPGQTRYAMVIHHDGGYVKGDFNRT